MPDIVIYQDAFIKFCGIDGRNQYLPATNFKRLSPRRHEERKRHVFVSRDVGVGSQRRSDAHVATIARH